MEVTQSQVVVAETLVKRIRAKNIQHKDIYKNSVEELFYFVLKTLGEEADKYEYVDKICRGFTIFLNYKVGEKRIMITDLANFQNFIFLDVLAIKEAKNVMKEVADMFNDLQYYQAEFHPFSRDSRGVLTVSINI